MEAEIIRALASLGGEVVIACVALGVFYKLADKYLSGFLSALQTQAGAMQTQAACLVEVKGNLTSFIGRDNNEHREILLGLRVAIKEIQDIGAEVKAQGEIIQGLYRDAGKSAPFARIG